VISTKSNRERKADGDAEKTLESSCIIATRKEKHDLGDEWARALEEVLRPDLKTKGATGNGSTARKT